MYSWRQCFAVLFALAVESVSVCVHRCLMHVEEMNGTWVKVLFLLMKLRREPTTEAKNQITL